MTEEVAQYDVLVVGGGPAGLSAALALGRARRSVLLCDAGSPRNARAKEMHGFISRDGSSPHELLAAARNEMKTYPTIEITDLTVTSITGDDGRFSAAAGQQAIGARKIILATGMIDDLPPIRGLKSWWGRRVFTCPYCDGWEFRDSRIAIAGESGNLVSLAQELYQWSQRLTVCGLDRSACGREDREWLAASGVPTTASQITELQGDASFFLLRLSDGTALECDALFLCVPLLQRSSLASALGCELTQGGRIAVDSDQRTTTAGVYAAGDASVRVHQIVFAASTGTAAGIAANNDLTASDVRALGKS